MAKKDGTASAKLPEPDFLTAGSANNTKCLMEMTTYTSNFPSNLLFLMSRLIFLQCCVVPQPSSLHSSLSAIIPGTDRTGRCQLLHSDPLPKQGSRPVSVNPPGNPCRTGLSASKTQTPTHSCGRCHSHLAVFSLAFSCWVGSCLGVSRIMATIKPASPLVAQRLGPAPSSSCPTHPSQPNRPPSADPSKTTHP